MDAAPSWRAEVKPIKVGVVLGSAGDQGGGVYASVRDMAQALLQVPDVQVTVFASDRSPSANRSEWGAVSLKVFPARGPASFGYAPGLGRALLAADLDVVHVHGLWMYLSIAARRWAAASGRRYVVSPHGMLDPWAVANSGWKKTLALRAYEQAHLDRAACIHALCEQERQAVRAFGLRNPVCLIPNGVQLPPEESASPRGGANARRTLLYLGRLTPKKGLVALLDAWASLRRNPEAQAWDLAIAGSGPEAFVAELRARAELLCSPRSMRFLGHVSGASKRAAFAQADAFILPSVSEGQPLAVLEAWSHGLPALITEQCNLPEGRLAGAALSIGPSTAEIADGLRRLFETPPEQARAMGRRGRLLVEKRFSWGSAALRWAEVYRWLSDQVCEPECVIRSA
ncbi:glycosyltransferase [Hansschlegelia beijingensis]|uniref:glycosyltransferase n=1 Tax=Hansschlegelia beijingensis TaxID=1133344 RepID=UPI00387EE970